MSNAVSAVATDITNGAIDPSRTIGQAATALVATHTRFGVVQIDSLAQDIARVAVNDPARAADMLETIGRDLPAADRQRLAEATAAAVDNRIAGAAGPGATSLDAAAVAERREALMLDLTQIGLSIAGIFDPTPVSDGLDGLISVFRGDWLGAGISVVSMIPYLGDAAKLGKLPKFLDTIANAVDLAKMDAAFAAAARPAFDKIAAALDAVPIDSLPAAAQDTLKAMRAKLDEVPAPTTARGADEAMQAGRTVSRNGYTYTLDGQGRVTHVEGDLTLNRTNTRDRTAQLEAGGADRLATDQGGHYIARIFDGPTDDFNHFAQNGNFNMGVYRSLERQWDRLVQDGHKVHVEIRPSYDGSSVRPSELVVRYTVDDSRTVTRIFENAPGGGG